MAPVVEGGLVVGVALVVDAAAGSDVVATDGRGDGAVETVSVPQPTANTAARTIAARRVGRMFRVVMVVIHPPSTNRQAAASPDQGSHPGEIPDSPDRAAMLSGREPVRMLPVCAATAVEMRPGQGGIRPRIVDDDRTPVTRTRL